MVKYLIEDVGVDPELGISKLPFFEACRSARFQIIKYYVDKFKFDINSPNENGDTVLFLAIDLYDHETVQFLVNECHAYPKNTPPNAFTPYQYAKYLGDTELMDILTPFEN